MQFVHYGTNDAGELTGDTYCTSCAGPGDVAESFVEADSPMHCADCERLLPVDLTDAGREYVADALLEGIELDAGRAGILADWADAYPSAVELAAERLAERGTSGLAQLVRDATEYRAEARGE